MVNNWLSEIEILGGVFSQDENAHSESTGHAAADLQ